MELNEFVRVVSEEFEEADQAMISADTRFKGLETWSSLQALIVVSKIDEHYQVVLNNQDLQKSQTFRDLFSLVQSMKIKKVKL